MCLFCIEFAPESGPFILIRHRDMWGFIVLENFGHIVLMLVATDLSHLMTLAVRC